MDGMEDNESRTAGPTPGATGEQVLDQLRRLRRSRDDKVLAGVCGGLGRSLGVDPLLLRVVVAVLVLFGGTGIVLYALGWLLLPTDDGSPSLGAQALDRHRYRPRGRTTALAVVLAVAVTIGVVGAFGRWDGPILLSLAVVGLLVWLVRRGSPVSPAQGADEPVAVSAPVPDAPTTAWAAAPPPPPRVAPAPPRPPRPRSHLFGATFSLVLIAVGVLAAFDVSGYEPPAGAYPALALTLTGLGLLAGTWFGRARGLIVWGLLLALVTTVASVAGEARGVSGRAVDQRVAITTTAALPTSDEFGAGEVEYDLTGLQLADESASMRSRIGFGQIVVVVPPDVDVTVDARTGVGGVSLFGSNTGGINEHRTRTDYGADGPGGGTLDLTLYAGFGHLEVHRATS
jgi:phage shock protein PspC (stress-responsive transcriptional regulator)